MKQIFPLILAFALGLVVVAGVLVYRANAESAGPELTIPHVDQKTGKRKPAIQRKARGRYSVSTKCLPKSLKIRLAQIEQKFGPVRVVSTYRKGAVIAGSGKPSYHAKCAAVDFHPPRGSYREVARYLKKNHDGGVGTYSGGHSHIHIDTGPSVRYHHCYTKSLRRRKCR